jgi:hypothetical protein
MIIVQGDLVHSPNQLTQASISACSAGPAWKGYRFHIQAELHVAGSG